jgi:flagellar biosynthesis chaperone FliJ
VRCDDQMLAGRRYLVQLMNMKNAVTVKQMDLSIHMQRVSQALQQSDVERQRYVKLNELHTGRQQRQEQRREQQEEDSYNLMHYNHLKGEVW